MTQVSMYGGDIANDIELDLDNHSNVSEFDNEEEIRKALEEFGEEPFDLTSSEDETSQNESRSSSVNFSNSKESFRLSKGSSISEIRVNGNSSTNGDMMVNSIMNGSYGKNKNVAPNGNGFNLNMLPNSVMDLSQNLIYPVTMRGKVDSQNPTTLTNGHVKLNGDLVNGNSGESILLQGGGTTSSTKTNKPRKQVTIMESSQKNKEQEEIEESNPTISLLHKQHCPRNENVTTHVDGDMWLTSENKDEQAKMMLELRERQVHRADEEIQKLQKDKRGLSHQIGLMKTEMVHMKSQHEEAEKLAHVKEQECEYLRMKLQETISEYEKAKGGEITARDEVFRLNTEIEKLKEEILLLSNIGQSTQKAEVSDVVRQLREKHSAEYVSWKKVVATLEGELRTYKRKLQLQKEQSFTGEVDASCQTEEVRILSPSKSPLSGEHQKRKEKTEIAILKDDEDGDLLIREKKIISLNEKFEELKSNFEAEKTQLVTSYESEIEQYRHRLATLPNELYRLWENTQRELGLQTHLDTRPICVDAFTYMEPEDVASQNDANEFKQSPHSEMELQKHASDLRDAEVQVDFSPTLSNREIQTLPQPQESITTKDTSSILVQTDEKETSHVVIQTEETLETYKVLGHLLETWSNEIQAAKASEEEAATRCREFETALNKLRSQFKLLHKLATKCRKESKKRDEAYKKQIDELNVRHMKVLKNLQDKLDVLT